MTYGSEPKTRTRDRLLVSGVFAGLIVVWLLTGLSNGAMLAQKRGLKQAVAGGVKGGVPGGIEGGVPGGIALGVQGGVSGGVSEGPPHAEAQVREEQPPRDARLLQLIEQAEENPLNFVNREGAPVTIVEARAKTIKYEVHGVEERADRIAEKVWFAPSLRMVSNSDKQIAALSLMFSAPESEAKHFVMAAGLKVEPFSTFSYSSFIRRSPQFDLDPSVVSVQVLGVRYEDGSGWGSLERMPPPPPPVRVPHGAAPPAPPPVIRKSPGTIAGSALKKVQPVYPPLAKTARITGAVVVEVQIDEDGVVTSATAINGHPLLAEAAEEAARQWRFEPTSVLGQRVRVMGTITFNFQL